MKKLLALGRPIVLVLLMIGAAVGAYFLYRTARAVDHSARQMVDGASQRAEVVAADQQLVNTSDYAGPASGGLTADQVQRFLRVQATSRPRLVRARRRSPKSTRNWERRVPTAPRCRRR